MFTQPRLNLEEVVRIGDSCASQTDAVEGLLKCREFFQLLYYFDKAI